MAATDQTYRKLKTMHLVFGISCLLMLFSTIWMLVQDYNKEFKPIQKKFHEVEEQSNLRAMLQQLPRGEDLQEKINNADTARQEYAAAQAKRRVEEKKYSAQRAIKTTQYQTIKASFDSQGSLLNIAVDDAAKEPDSRRKATLDEEIKSQQKELGALSQKLAEAQNELDAADLEYKTNVTDPLSKTKNRMDTAEDDLKRVTGSFDRFAKAAAQKGWKFGDTIRALPILDGFESPTKIKQIVLNDLTIDYGGFRNVPRYDRCATCHLGIDRSMFDKSALTALTQPQPDLEKSLKLAKRLLLERKNKGEDLGFDPNDLPERAEVVKLTKGEITQYATHPRLDLFVDSNSPHASEQFGCTICHGGQGSSTSFVLATHTPADARQTEEWKKEHDWKADHDWDFPMLSKRFIESSCLQCHHQVTDLIRYGSKEEAPKLLKGYNLVKDNGCFGCHEISGMKSGRPVGPDLRLESTPALELLSAADQERARADALNPPGTMRKVGPSLRRVAEKTNEKWAREWIRAPRDFREDTKMPHFYGLSTNSPDVLPEDQKKFPDAEIHSITHYLFVESNSHLKAGDTYRLSLLATIRSLYDLTSAGDEKRLSEKADEPAEYQKLEKLHADIKLTEQKDVERWAALDRKVRGGVLAEKERKELAEATRSFANLALLSDPTQAVEINNVYAELKQHQDRLLELKGEEDVLRKKIPPTGLNPARTKALQNEWTTMNATTQDQWAKVKGATDKLIALAKPVSVQERVVNFDNQVVAKDTFLKGDEKDEKHGKQLFTEKGCMACHSHTATEPSVIGEANFGPNLSRIADKLGPDGGNEESKRRWLVQWLLNPNIHNPRTKMPITFLKDQDASDIASWLLSQKPDYKGKDPTAPENDTLVEMARMYLAKAPGMTVAEVDKYLPKSKQADALPSGIDDEERQKFIARDADEQALLTEKGKTVSRDKLLWYIGKKSISRLGCYGCHDIPGFETAKPIGTALNDWGKKDPERIAFEDSEAFVASHYNLVENRDDVKDKTKADRDWRAKTVDENGQVKKLEPYEKYFAEQLENQHHTRQGFLHLKLAEPRSYDYNRIRTWDDRLRMPQFQFSRPRQHKGETPEEYEVRRSRDEAVAREAVMTFILGLTADPIPLKYVANPNPDRAAEVRGRQAIDKFNCAGCHQIRPGVYEFKPSKDAIDKLEKSFNLEVGNTDTVKDMPKLKADHLFPMHNAWVGTASPYPDRMQVFGVSPKADEEPREDNPDAPDKVLRVRLTDALRFTNNQKVLRDIPASSKVMIPEKDLLSRAEPWGGAFVQMLIGSQDDDGAWQGYLTKTGEFAGKPDNAMSTLPPPLIREGERVQTRWLYSFLLNPTPIRPETYMKLRMPRFNMSAEEAQAIVSYFAAAAKTGNPGIGLTYPYDRIPQQDKRYWAARSEEYIKANNNDKVAAARANAQVANLTLLATNLDKDEKTKKEAEAVRDQIKKLQKEITDKKFAEMRKEWLTPDAYEADSYKLLTQRGNICLSCHNVGSIKSDSPKGPPLELAAEQLRPEWTQEWIGNPARLFPYATIMSQNFPNDKKDPVTGIATDRLDSFYGTPAEQVRAARDALMNLPNLSNLPENRRPPK